MGIRDTFTGPMRAIEDLPARTRKRAGMAVGGGASIGLIVSGIGNVYQMHVADQKNIRVMAAEEREAHACEERVGHAWRAFRDHMREVHDL